LHIRELLEYDEACSCHSLTIIKNIVTTKNSILVSFKIERNSVLCSHCQWRCGDNDENTFLYGAAQSLSFSWGNCLHPYPSEMRAYLCLVDHSLTPPSAVCHTTYHPHYHLQRNNVVDCACWCFIKEKQYRSAPFFVIAGCVFWIRLQHAARSIQCTGDRTRPTFSSRPIGLRLHTLKI